MVRYAPSHQHGHQWYATGRQDPVGVDETRACMIENSHSAVVGGPGSGAGILSRLFSREGQALSPDCRPLFFAPAVPRSVCPGLGRLWLSVSRPHRSRTGAAPAALRWPFGRKKIAWPSIKQSRGSVAFELCILLALYVIARCGRPDLSLKESGFGMDAYRRSQVAYLGTVSGKT